MVTKFLAAAAAVTLAAAPAMAASNQASSLSLASSVKSVRADASVGKKKSKALSGGAIALIVIGVGGAIGGIVAATSSSR